MNQPGKLGRKPPKNAPAVRLGDHLTGVIPDHPIAADYLAQLNGGWQVLGNDQYGDCVAVAWANNRRLVSTILGTGEYPSQDNVFTVYKTQNPAFPSEDNGMCIQTLLEWLVTNTAPDGSRAVCFAKVDHTNVDEVKAALAIFGSLILGINVTDANEREFAAQQPWDYVTTASILGGHGVVAGGYGAGTGVLGGDEKFITWGQETSFTDVFWTNQVEEAWVLIYPEHLGTREFEQGVDVDALAAAYQELTGQPFPAAKPAVRRSGSLISDLIGWFQQAVHWVESL